MARHDSSQTPTARRALAALATAGVALGAGAGTAAAADTDPVSDVLHTRPATFGKLAPQAGLQGALGTLPHTTGPLMSLKPNPLAGTGVDPLSNGVGTQLADFRPVSTKDVTRPVAQAQSIGSLPLVGQAKGLLAG